MSLFLGSATAFLVFSLLGALLARASCTHGRRSSQADSVVAIWRWVSRCFGRADIADQLPAFLEDMARAVRGGQSMRAAIVLCVDTAPEPLRSDLALIAARLETGATFEDALHEWIRARAEAPTVALVGVALSMAVTAGGSVAQAIDGVADSIRSELDIQAEVRAMASQANASAMLVAALPVAFGAVAGSTDARILTFLFRTQLGVVCLVAGVGLDLVGWVWMRRITGSIAW